MHAGLGGASTASISVTQYVEGVTSSLSTGIVMMWKNASDVVQATGTDAPLPVDITDSTLAVTQSGTWNIGTVTAVTAISNALPAGTNNIGDVDVLTVPADPFGANADAASATGSISAKLRFIAATGIPITGSVAVTNGGLTELAAAINASSQMDVNIAASAVTIAVSNAGLTALNGAIAGTEVQVDVVAALPAGTNAIGKLAANSGVDIGDVDVLSIAAGNNNIGDVDIASGTITTVTTLTGGGVAHDGVDSGNPHKIGFKAYSPDGTTPGTAVAELDRTDAKADLDGRLYVNTVSPVAWSYHENSSNALTDTSVKAAPGAGFSIFVTDIIFSTGAATACNIFFEEGATTILGPYYLEATAGRGLAIHFTTPKLITANTALTVTTSAAIAHGLDVTGYVSAV